MALKSVRDQQVPNDRSRHGSLITANQVVHQEDYGRLQEQLAQSLKREMDLHKKLRHLQEQLQLMEVRPHSPGHSRSMSDGSLSGTPELLWDSELSQTSAEGSPHLFQPALIVVSASPKSAKKVISSAGETTQQVSSHSNQPVHSSAVNSRNTNGKSLSLEEADSSERLALAPDKSQLAPSPQDYRGVRHEREKPPPSLSPTLQHSSSLPQEKDVPHTIPSSFSFPASHNTATEVHYVPMESKEDSKFAQSIDAGHVKDSTDGHTSVNGSSSTPVKRRTKGYRGRSNTTSLIPNWIRKRREHSSSPSSSVTARNNSPVESIADMFERFVRAASSSIQPDSLAAYIDHHWSEVCQDCQCPDDVRKYRDAVWDMFQSETKFLTRFLQPLEQVYKGFLEELHFHGVLKVANVDKIFANLSELCELSASVARDLFQLFEGRSSDQIAPNKELILAFSMFGHKFNPVYQRFCVNFEKQRGFVKALAQLPEFEEYMRVCRTHETVGKNDFTALLIAPMNHQCHYQLLLEKVLKYTKDQSEKDLLSSAIKAFVVSLKELEANIEENRRSDEMLELQETLCWPSLSQLDPGAYIPDTLLSQLSSQPCSSLLASKERQLLHRGTLKLIEIKHTRDVEAFLFTDSLLLTQQSSAHPEKKGKKEPMNQLTRYHVLGHPLLLCALDIHDIPPQHYHGHLLTLIERNSFQQLVASYSLQAPTKEKKATWLSQLTQARNRISYKNSPNYRESDV